MPCSYPGFHVQVPWRLVTASLVFVMCLLCAACLRPDETISPADKERVLHELRALRATMQTTVICEPGTRRGKAGATDGETTAKGIEYNVRTPDAYEPRIAYPLLMVYAPAGASAVRSEQFTDLTPYATAAGFVVAYANHRRMSIPTIIELSTIPGLIAKKWCIDEPHVYATGHSDGGTVALALAVLEKTRGIMTGIAPSAAGMRGADIGEYSCPAPLPVMILHGAHDRLFPGFGAEVAAWWAACNQCDPTPSAPLANGCVVYPDCAGDVATWYCEGAGSHTSWPLLNGDIVKFLATAGISQR